MAVACLRSRFMEDSQWTKNPFQNSLQKGTELCDVFACKGTRNKELNVGIVLFRHSSKGFFTPQDLAAIELLHSSIEWFFSKIHREIYSDQSVHGTLAEPGSLSKRQLETLEHLLEGLTDKEIASRMELSVTTVRQYVRGIYKVFGVQSRCELLAIWLRKFRDPDCQLLESA